MIQAILNFDPCINFDDLFPPKATPDQLPSYIFIFPMTCSITGKSAALPPRE
jgi:hypothetical protein